MRLIRLSFILLLLCIMNIQAQNSISINDAVRSAIENNIELQKRKNELNKNESILSEAGRIPNPTFSYSREDLKLNNSKFGEWIASGSVPLNFLWERWSNVESNAQSLEAAKLLLENSIQTVSVQVMNSYLNYHFLSLLTEELNSVLDKINKVAETARQRVKQGDIPEYELQRILLEVAKFNAEIKRVEIDKANSHSELKLLTGLKKMNISTEGFSITPVSLSSDELIKSAYQNRKDLKAMDMLIESEKAFLAHNKLKIIPNISLTAGYKKQADNFSGSVMLLSFEIPLFKRNQLEIELSENELNTLIFQRKYLTEQIQEEVRNSLTKYLQYKELYENNKFLQPLLLFSSSAYSYEQGEKSLVEFLDGLNAYIDALMLSKDLELNYLKSFFELQKAAALNPVNEIK
ncbi:MAG: TolC family protein [Ignavibacteria bacterium]|nr:TolC family protein [Ignavibacteria bacterium]